MMSKAIIFFTRKARLLDLGVSSRALTSILMGKEEIECVGIPSKSPKIFLVNDQLDIKEFKIKVWIQLIGIDEIAFIHHSAPDNSVIEFLHQKTTLSLKGSHQQNLPGYSLYRPLRKIIKMGGVDERDFDSLWELFQNASNRSRDIDITYEAGFESIVSSEYPIFSDVLLLLESFETSAIQPLKSWGITPLLIQEIVDVTPSDDYSLIIPCEINLKETGETVRRTEFYGIELGRKLRIDGFKGKILFVSVANSEEISRSKLNSIIHTIGHSFISLSSGIISWRDQLEKTRVLSDIEWYDITTNYCSKYGLAQQYLHNLHGIANDDSFSFDKKCQRIIECLKNIGALYNVDVQILRDQLDFNDLSEAVRLVENYCNEVIALNESTNEIEESTSIDRKPWSVLLVDDEITEEHQLVVELSKRVGKVYCTNNAQSAQEILAEDRQNGELITLVVSDYRLEKKENGHTVHQAIQGYMFLIDTAKDYPHKAKAALSALPRRFLLQSFKRMGIRANVYSKKDYLASANTLKILVEELLDQGEDSFNAIVRKPRISSEHWENFETFYSYHRCSRDYSSNEAYISEKARSYCLEYQREDNHFSVTLSNYSTQLSGKKKTPENPKAFKEFLEKMVCRRAILWYARYGTPAVIDSPEDVMHFLKGPAYTGSESKNDATNKINTNLAIRLKEFPWNTTIEEKSWLIFDMKVDAHDIEQLESQENEILLLCETMIAERLAPFVSHVFPPNTFFRCKRWFTSAAYFPELTLDQIDIQLKVCTTLRARVQVLTEDPKSLKGISRSLRRFYNYLTKAVVPFLRKRKEEKSNAQTISISNEEKRTRVIEKAKKKFANDPESLEGIEATAYLFFSENAEACETMGVSKCFNLFQDYHNKYSPKPSRHRDYDDIAFAVKDESALDFLDELDES